MRPGNGRQKKIRYRLGSVTDFVVFSDADLCHYPPLCLAAENNLYREDENKNQAGKGEVHSLQAFDKFGIGKR